MNSFGRTSFFLFPTVVFITLVGGVAAWSIASPFLSIFETWFLYPETAAAAEGVELKKEAGVKTSPVTPDDRSGTASKTPSRHRRWGIPADGAREEGSCTGDIQEKILSQATRTIIVINEFKEQYTMDKYGMTWDEANAIFSDVEKDVKYLEVCDEQECISLLPMLPSSPPPPTADGEGAEELMTQVFNYCRQYCEALNQIFLDENLSEGTCLVGIDEAQRNMESLARSVAQCDESPDEELVQRLVGMMFKKESEDLAKRRGFGTLRQCLLGLQYIIDVFTVDSY